LVPGKTLAEVIAYVKANPGKVNYASYSAGTISRVMGLQLNKAAGIEMARIAYKGAPPALVGLTGGHMSLMLAGITNAAPLISGRQDHAVRCQPAAVFGGAVERADIHRTWFPATRSAALIRDVDHARRAGRDTETLA
jgi:tripartite-type tricarboxylate transporter receptor subunit TctC